MNIKKIGWLLLAASLLFVVVKDCSLGKVIQEQSITYALDQEEKSGEEEIDKEGIVIIQYPSYLPVLPSQTEDRYLAICSQHICNQPFRPPAFL